MYKIMLADDEGIVIDSLRMIIEKNFGTSCRVESAKTGRGVIELAEQFSPDIGIMDIQMPGINGMDAMEEIKKFNSSTRFIIMSAYDKFDYAKRAIDLGVIEYLTKPANSAKIVKAIEKAMRIVDAERSKRERDLKNKEKLETVIPIIESGLIYTILFEEDYIDETENFKNLLDIEDDYGYVFIIEFGDDMQEGTFTNPVGAAVKAQSFYREMREIVKEFFTCMIGPVMANRIVVVVPCSEPTVEYNVRVKNIERARDMIRKLRKRIDVHFHIGIGTIRGTDELFLSYKEANKALKNIKGSVAHIKDAIPNQEIEKDYPVETEKKLLVMLKKGNLSGLITEGNQFFDWMIESYGDYELDIKLKVLEMAMVAEREAFESGGMSYYFRDRADYLSGVMAMKTYEELRRWFVDKLSIACHTIISQRGEMYSGVVVQAKQYMDANYHKDISLDEVSRTVNISPYYFSKVFKEETGENFIEYLTKVRIQHAKELLENKDISIKEVCVMSGYSDPNYFSRIFKKCVGVTPTEYREGKS